MSTSTLLSLVLVSSAAAAQTHSLPVDFHLRYEWKEASLPPPYHYEYTLELGPGAQGRIDFWPDYPGEHTPVWKESFTLDSERWQALFARLSELGVFAATEAPSESLPLVGGRLARLEAIADGRVHVLEGGVEEGKLAAIHAAVVDLVPEQLWRRLRERRHAYHTGLDERQVH